MSTLYGSELRIFSSHFLVRCTRLVKWSWRISKHSTSRYSTAVWMSHSTIFKIRTDIGLDDMMGDPLDLENDDVGDQIGTKESPSHNALIQHPQEPPGPAVGRRCKKIFEDKFLDVEDEEDDEMGKDGVDCSPVEEISGKSPADISPEDAPDLSPIAVLRAKALNVDMGKQLRDFDVEEFDKSRVENVLTHKKVFESEEILNEYLFLIAVLHWQLSPVRTRNDAVTDRSKFKKHYSCDVCFQPLCENRANSFLQTCTPAEYRELILGGKSINNKDNRLV